MSRSLNRSRVTLPLLALLLVSACGLRPMQTSGGDRATSGGDNSGSFSDAFVPGQTGNWLFEQDELASTAITNEQLVITIAAPNTIQYATLGDQEFADFVLEVDTWPTKTDAVAAIKQATRGLGAHATLDSSSSPEARRQAVQCVRTWGSACFVGEGGQDELTDKVEQRNQPFGKKGLK